MNKLSKLVVMAIIMLAIVAVSINVNAYTNDELLLLVQGAYTLGEGDVPVYELKEADKLAITKYLTENPVSDEVATSIKDDLVAIGDMIEATGTSNLANIETSVMEDIIAIAQSAGQKAGLKVAINSVDGTFTIKTENGTVLASDTYIKNNTSADVTDPTETEKSENQAEEKSDAKTDEKSSKAKLLYTGADSFVYVLPLLAIVAVAIVAKKRA